MRAMRDLLRRRVGIAVHRDGFDAQPLQFDDDFLAQLAGAQQHHLHGIGCQRFPDAHDSTFGCAAPAIRTSILRGPNFRASIFCCPFGPNLVILIVVCMFSYTPPPSPPLFGGCFSKIFAWPVASPVSLLRSSQRQFGPVGYSNRVVQARDSRDAASVKTAPKQSRTISEQFAPNASPFTKPRDVIKPAWGFGHNFARVSSTTRKRQNAGRVAACGATYVAE